MELNIANLLRKISIAILCLLPIVATPKTALISLKDHYPQKYVVQRGDTLYDIAGKYLNKPWEWKKIWRDNPQVRNPSRLYPGAILTLRYYDGKPYIKLLRRGTYKISPHARARPSEEAIPPVFLSDIRPFLNGSRVFDKNELAHEGYVIAFNGERIVAGQDDEVYVKDLRVSPKGEMSYSLYRPGKIYYDKTKDPDDPGYILGYSAIYLGDAELVTHGNPATMVLTTITRGVHIKDKVIPNNKAEFDLYFEPQAPDAPVLGQIIELLNSEAQVASNQVIAINRGKKQHIEEGDVVAIYQRPRVVIDPFNKGKIRYFWFFSKPPDPDHAKVRLPKERIGEAMVFRAFTNVSYALVVRSTRAIHEKDLVTNP